MARRQDAPARRKDSQETELSAYTQPPHNIEAEEGLLSAILLDEKTITNVADLLTPDDFYKEANGHVFAAARALFEKNEPADLVSVADQLQKSKKIEAIGGNAYLARLVETVPMAVNPPHYAKIIKEKSVLRRLIRAAREIIRECHENKGEVEAAVDFAENAVFQVAEDRAGATFTLIEPLITESFLALEQRARNKALVTGVPTDFRDLDSLTSGLQPSDLIILAARPSMGKTAFALNIAVNAARHGTGVAVFSLEMSKQQLALRMLCGEARVDSQKVRSGFLGRDDNTRLMEAGHRLHSLPIYIDDSPGLSALDVRARVRRLQRDKGIGLVIIDYLQLMQSHSDAERRDLEISEISRSLKGLAKEASLPVVALSQLNRNLEQREDKRPRLSDLRESGALEQDADLILFIYREAVYKKDMDEHDPRRNLAEILVEKHRNGATGKVELIFMNEYTRFEDKERQYGGA
jgi:replicative DNA helicase